MRMDSGDEYLSALQDFAKAEEKQLTPELVDILEVIARTGKCLYNWEILKPFLAYILDEVTKDFLSSSDTKDTDDESLEATRKSLIESFKEFNSAPFTLQRLAELLADPKKHYKAPAKYFRGLQKNIFVVSTIDVEHASVKSLKRTHDQISEHKQNGSLNMCSPNKVRRIGSRIIRPTNDIQNDTENNMSVDNNEEKDKKDNNNLNNESSTETTEQNINNSEVKEEEIKNGLDVDNKDNKELSMETNEATTTETMTTDESIEEPSINNANDENKESTQNCNGEAAMEEG